MLNRRLIPALRPVLILWATFWNVMIAAGAPGAAPLTNAMPVLTNVWQIRQLTPAQAERNPNVRFAGVVTVCLRTNLAFVQDPTGGVLVYFTHLDCRLNSGLSVRVSGQVEPGQYAPVVFRGRLTRSPQSFPPPRPPLLSFDQMLEDKNHARFVQTIGVVRCVPASHTPGTYLEVVAGQSRLLVIISGELGHAVPSQFFGATVKLRGVCASLFNRRRQIRGAKMYVSGFTNITVLQPATPVADLPLRHIASLADFTPPSLYVHRVRVHGTVLDMIRTPTPTLYVADQTDSLVAQLQTGQPSVKVGSRVELVGFPEQGDFSPLLKDCTVRSLGTAPSPQPLRIQPEQLIRQELNAHLVRVHGRLINLVRDPGRWTLFLRSGRLVFGAELPLGKYSAAVPNLLPGSRVQLTGVAQLTLDDRHQVRSLHLLLRSAHDIQLLSAPPWWNASRVAIVGAILLVFSLAVVAWLVSLRLQVRRQTATLQRQVQRETALAAQYRDLYENAHDLIFVKNQYGQLISINPAVERITGHPRQAILASDEARQRSWPAPAHDEAWFGQLSEQRPACQFECELTAKDGSRVVLDVTARLALHNGEQKSVHGIARDITERKVAAEKLRSAKEDLEAANQDLEHRNRELRQANHSLQREIAERRRAEMQITQARQELWDASRQAGKTEMATNVLHNAGNVLNSISVSVALMEEMVRNTKSISLAKVAEMLKAHRTELGTFLCENEKGRRLVAFLGQLNNYMSREQTGLLGEAENLSRNLKHVRDIIALQQNYARNSGHVETLPLREIAEDALRMHTSSNVRQQTQIVRDYQDASPITVHRQQVLHILFNLLRNAQRACDESRAPDKRITVRIFRSSSERVCLQIADNGVGIAPENLPQLFAYGFTTRQQRPGFGLHSAAQAAEQMDGTLSAHSEGPGCGATFTLDLPVQRPTG